MQRTSEVIHDFCQYCFKLIWWFSHYHMPLFKTSPYVFHVKFFVGSSMLYKTHFPWMKPSHPSPLIPTPSSGSSLPGSWVPLSIEFLQLTAWSQTLLHTQEGRGQVPGAGEEKPLCFQESFAAGLHTPVTPGHPNVASFCTHAQECTTKPVKSKK